MSSRLQLVMQREMTRTADWSREHRLSGNPLHNRTNNLRSSIHGEASATDSEITGIVGSNMIYAPVHEFGAVIRAKNAPFLRFQVNGHWVSVKEVTIPARPFLAPAVDAMRQEIIDRLRDGAIEALK